MKRLLIGLLLVLALGGAFFGGTRLMDKKDAKPAANDPAAQQEDPAPATQGGEFTFAKPKKGAHFESSTPAHGSTFAAVPAGVVIDFNFDLATNSTIKIEKDGKDYGTSGTTVDANKLAMRRKMAPDAPDGLYTVNYNGCWPDKTCHDGHFQFAINRDKINEHSNSTGRQEVTILMSQNKFSPNPIRISKGAKVTWINNDDVDHYVNTDSHPAHTHVPGLNSRAITKGQSYSYTFNTPGAYPYHCSAHAADMTSTIVVE